MILTEQIKEIRKANENGKLVIFVGSGVSKNSGLPSWNDLIEKFAEELAYDKCESCMCKSEKCPIDKCQQKTNFTQEEYLKIPEYYYCQNSPDKYEAIIKKSLNTSAEPNPIDEIIFRLNPHHIITTNYDHLLENTEEPNRRLYSVIRTDKDLLSPQTSQYIIKMHGDIDDPETIVLKESDYIHYSQNHVLIETFIKSLLIDHVFLFVGYSLSDYNLKLILGWVNYLAKQNGSENRPNHYLIQTPKSEIKSYELKYFTENHLQVLNANETPQTIIEKSSSLELQEIGKRIYACLEYIENESYDFQVEKLEDILNEKYQMLKDYHRISYQDLSSVYSFKDAVMVGRELYFPYNDDSTYEKVKNTLETNSDKSKFIKNIFLKTGILTIRNSKNNDTYVLSDSNSAAPNITDELFQLYLNNQYDELCSKLEDVEDKAVTAYYYWLCAPQKKKHIHQMEELKKEISLEGNVLKHLFFTYNAMLLDFPKNYEIFRKTLRKILKTLTPQQEKITKYFPKILNDTNEEYSQLQTYFGELEIEYTQRRCTIRSIPLLGQMQALTYDYYFYCKRNYLMTDRVANMSIFLKLYLKAILCTYSSGNNLDTRHHLPWPQPPRDIPLSEIDLDMFIKHTRPNDLLRWLSEYKVDTITYEEGVDVIEKYCNLCTHLRAYSEFKGDSAIYLQDMNWLESFSILLTKSGLSPKNADTVIEAATNLLEVEITNVHHAYLNSVLISLSHLIPAYQSEKWITVLDILTKPDNIPVFRNMRFHEKYLSCIEALSHYTTPEINTKIENYLDSIGNTSDKCNCLFLFTEYIDWTRWAPYLLENLQNININGLYYLVRMKYLPVGNKVTDRFVQEIQKEIDYKSTGSNHIPDPIQLSIIRCIILHINNGLDISQLAPYCKYSDALSFLISPDNFDYTKVNTSIVEWEWIFSNETYAQKLKKHKSEILSESLLTEYKMGRFTPGQYKIVFGILLDPEELWTFGLE